MKEGKTEPAPRNKLAAQSGRLGCWAFILGDGFVETVTFTDLIHGSAEAIELAGVSREDSRDKLDQELFGVLARAVRGQGRTSWTKAERRAEESFCWARCNFSSTLINLAAAHRNGEQVVLACAQITFRLRQLGQPGRVQLWRPWLPSRAKSCRRNQPRAVRYASNCWL